MLPDWGLSLLVNCPHDYCVRLPQKEPTGANSPANRSLRVSPLSGSVVENQNYFADVNISFSFLFVIALIS